MRLVHEDEALDVERSVVVVGVFDGVHLGHQRLVDEARATASAVDGPLVVVLFDRHPLTVTDPPSAPRLLSNVPQRVELLGELGVDMCYVLRFDEERSLEDPADFVRTVLSDTLGAAVYLSGENHHFGHRAKGDANLVSDLGATLGIKVVVIPLLLAEDGEPISSTKVRATVASGDVAAAGHLLGRPFELRGVVEHGDARGRQLGFPTANVAIAGDMQLPANGVYAGWYVRPDGSEHPAAINIGRRPTFYGENGLLLVEAYLLDFSGDLYGEHPSVRITHRLRDEVKFDGVDALIAQMELDVEETRRLLARA